jgi:hypothetical protein
MKQSNSYKEESKSPAAKLSELPRVYKKSGIVFRAQNYEQISLENLWPQNKDGFEIKKLFSSIGYKPLDRITD